MLDKLKKGWRGWLVGCLMVSIIVYVITGLWCFSAAMIAGVFKIPLASGMAVLFIVFLLWEFFAQWREETRDDD